MVLELIIIGGAIYYYVKKNKQEKAKKLAFAQGQPWVHKDGSVTYPPNYAGLPPYSEGDFKQQIPAPAQSQSQSQPREYWGPVRSSQITSIPVQDKETSAVETREVVKSENEKN